MKRDMELVVEILKQVETSEDARVWITAQSHNHSHEMVMYNVGLMYDAGLIHAEDASTMGSVNYRITGMTWIGHDFLDAARNEQVMEKAKTRAFIKGFDFKTLPFDVAKELLLEGVKTLIFS